jgi:demethylmenaquinone methyltransferase / 2-methoxy-6-polyprenyl-1,4-benzoquinol methylase
MSAEVFSGIATNYDRINKILSLGQDQNWRRKVVERLPEGRILDLGAGTGAANEIFGDRLLTGLDPAPEMLALNDAADRVVAYGEHLPFADRSFDAVFSAYVVRNLTSVSDTVNEIARVLKPGGAAGIVDLGRPRNRAAAKVHRAGSAATLHTVGVIARAHGEYAYLHRSLDKLPQPEELYAGLTLEIEDIWRMGPLGFVYGIILRKQP